MDRIKELYTKYKQNTISVIEKEELFRLLKTSDHEELEKLVSNYLEQETPTDLSHLDADAAKIMERIKQRIETEPGTVKPKLGIWIKTIVAAATIAGCLYFVYKYNSKDIINTSDEHVQVINDVAPGGKRATLTLADGRTIVLDSANTGQLATVAGTVISKTSDGELIYQDQAPGSDVVQSNIVSIPRGGEYQLQLPDGTKVWLNAATKIEYPTRFNAAERRVKVTGEAYFEVTKDAEHPFIVETDKQEIKVLGTHFNVNTYNTGKTVTTLAEGSVKVNSSGSSKLLKPGQQSILFNGALEVSNADMERTLAWKNGLLFFKDTPLKEVLDEVSRWYDVDIVYQKEVSAQKFTGGVGRSSNLSAMLRILNFTGVKAKLERKNNQNILIID